MSAESGVAQAQGELDGIMREIEDMLQKACGDDKQTLQQCQLVQDNLALAVILEAKIRNNRDFPRAGDVMLDEAERERQLYTQVFGSCKTADDFAATLDAIEAELPLEWVKRMRSQKKE